MLKYLYGILVIFRWPKYKKEIAGECAGMSLRNSCRIPRLKRGMTKKEGTEGSVLKCLYGILVVFRWLKYMIIKKKGRVLKCPCGISVTPMLDD